MQKRPVGSALALVALLTAAAIVAGIVYEQVQRREDRKRFPQIGRSVDIGGRTLNIYCSGAGKPVVVLDSGAPLSGYSWVVIQRAIAKFTRACWFDRAGYGWSAPGPDPRSSKASAQDLHELLRRAAIPAPFVLVGERFAAFDVRVYNGLYPSEVAGAILVDAVPDDEVTNPRSRGPLPQFLRHPQSVFAQGLNRIGVLRLFGVAKPRNRIIRRPDGFTPEEWATVMGLRSEPKTRTALLQEAVAESIAQAQAAGTMGNRPLIVLSSESSGEENTSRLSTREREIVVEGGGHAIQYNAPDAVIGAVREVVADIRKPGLP